MPLFHPDSLSVLVGKSADGEHTLDLRGISLGQAQSAISQLLERPPSDGVASIVIRIDPATPTSGETLFLPIGRQLLEARKSGLITRFHPLPEADGGGFYIELPDRPQDEEPPQ